MIGIVDADIPHRRKGIGANKYTAYTYVTDTHKRCSLCEQIKVLADFHKDPKNIHGKGTAYYCKECANRKSREHHRRRQAGDPAYRRAKRSDNIKAKHGITIEEYEAKQASQEFQCAICDTYLLRHKFFAHLDHDHNTGKLRDFLCTNCNRALGHFMDSRTLLLKAAEYLKKHNALDRMQSEGSSP